MILKEIIFYHFKNDICTVSLKKNIFQQNLEDKRLEVCTIPPPPPQKEMPIKFTTINCCIIYLLP